jgi:hypothetical protein
MISVSKPTVHTRDQKCQGKQTTKCTFLPETLLFPIAMVGRDRIHQENDKQLVLCLASDLRPGARPSWAKIGWAKVMAQWDLKSQRSHQAVAFHWEYSIVLDTMCSELHRLPRGIFDPTCALTQQKHLPTCWVQVFLQVRLVVPMGEIVPLPTTGYPQVHHQKRCFWDVKHTLRWY